MCTFAGRGSESLGSRGNPRTCGRCSCRWAMLSVSAGGCSWNSALHGYSLVCSCQRESKHRDSLAGGCKDYAGCGGCPVRCSTKFKRELPLTESKRGLGHLGVTVSAVDQSTVSNSILFSAVCCLLSAGGRQDYKASMNFDESSVQMIKFAFVHERTIHSVWTQQVAVC